MISINATLIVQVINFLVLMWILNKILFKPILKVIEERERNIEGVGVEMARLKEDAERKAEELEAQMHEARTSAGQRRDEIRSQASAQANEIIQQAQIKADEHVSTIIQESEKQTAQVRESLLAFKDALAEMITVKVIGRKV